MTTILIKNTDLSRVKNEQVSLEKSDNNIVSPSLHNPRSKKNKMLHSTIVPKIRQLNNDQSDIDIFGMSVASQLKKLTEEQAVLARDKIQSILTRCRLTDLRARNTNFSKSSSNSQLTKPWIVPKQECTHTAPSNSSLEPYSNCDTSSGAEYENEVETVYSEESN